ncbi:uncharacterized protein LOC115751449 [Rhodamnia argentea]|uniref:Uncharacterized protein LOC115751449 n=1 Tax=Rhodamnia argentea TaxID=178133 RepID=A0A8B8QG72_9MYRT|nr:uncharacterized protein LOC115751449 [Rhodamnia argentea]
MERSEPTLVPEWLRNSGGGGTSGVSSSASHSSHSEPPSSGSRRRSKTSKGGNDFDGRHSALDRTSSLNLRGSSGNNGLLKNAYSSFNRSHHDRERGRSNYDDYWDLDGSDSLGCVLNSRIEKDPLRHSHSMIPRRHGELLPRRVVPEVKNGSNDAQNNIAKNGPISGVSTIHHAVSEKDFPLLGAEERQGMADKGRASSPGLPSNINCLPGASSALASSEGWTSALAQVPSLSPTNGLQSSSHQQNTVAAPVCGTAMATTGLKMAEALAQAPLRAKTAPQLSVKTQRLEELAIKQSRQLIPVTPSGPKTSVLNSSEKSKSKAAVRNGERISAVRSGQQQLSLSANQLLRGGHTKLDSPQSPHAGKFLVLKPTRENGVSHAPKDMGSPTSVSGSKSLSSQPTVASSAAPAPSRNANNPTHSSLEDKSAVSFLNPATVLEKRPSSSHAQSRSEFFNLIKRKNSTKGSSVLLESGPVISSPSRENSCQMIEQSVNAPGSPVADNGGEICSSGGSSLEALRLPNDDDGDMSLTAAVYPNEEEVAFLRSLGWDENAGEDEGLTEEEINAFYREYTNLGPSSNVPRRGANPLETV